MAYKLAEETIEKFQECILICLIQRGGRTTISTLLEDMRCDGWKRLGRLSDFELMLEENGFTLDRRTYNDQPYVHGEWTTNARGHKTIHTVVKTYVTV